MDIKDILEEVEKNLTGDPRKDGPYLKEQSEKYRDSEFSQELDREFSRIIYEISEKDYMKTLNNFLDAENPKVEQQLEDAEKRFKNHNYNGGLAILEEIIKNNIFAWNDTGDCTYKCFGTPLEYLLYKNLFEDPDNVREIKPVNCDLARVYWMYCHGLTQKKRYDEALKAIRRAEELNPVDPEVYIHYAELCKLTRDTETLKKCADMLLKCAVSKKQVGYAYFAYSFYFSEIKQYDKALALLQMSHIFRESDLYATELEYITKCMGLGSVPPKYSTQELMNILLAENIQPGPSAAVVHLANNIAKNFESELELEYARYFYEIVWELTEDEDTHDHIQELSKTISDMKSFK
ncbi:MAG: tetratricopeptide repeat protein [Porcipelethomonas sp.]